jgi:spermidine/putrescine transport system permease protein
VQLLFTKQDDAPLGSAVSIVMMLLIGLLVAIFLRAINYAKIRKRING